MCGKLYLAAIILIVYVQIGINALNPALEKCKAKITEQISNVKFGRYPDCFHASKLEGVKNNTDIIQEFYKTLTDNCKAPTSENIQECLQHFKDFIESRSSDIQAGILGAVHSFYEATRDCIKQIVDGVGNLDKYVLNGCEGNLAN